IWSFGNVDVPIVEYKSLRGYDYRITRQSVEDKQNYSTKNAELLLSEISKARDVAIMSVMVGRKLFEEVVAIAKSWGARSNAIMGNKVRYKVSPFIYVDIIEDPIRDSYDYVFIVNEPSMPEKSLAQ